MKKKTKEKIKEKIFKKISKKINFEVRPLGPKSQGVGVGGWGLVPGVGNAFLVGRWSRCPDFQDENTSFC